MQKLWLHIVLVRCRFCIPFILPVQCAGKTTNLLGGLWNRPVFCNLFKFRAWNSCNKTTEGMEYTDKVKPLLQWLRCSCSIIPSKQIWFVRDLVSPLNQGIARKTATSHMCLTAGQAWMQYNSDLKFNICSNWLKLSSCSNNFRAQHRKFELSLPLCAQQFRQAGNNHGLPYWP